MAKRALPKQQELKVDILFKTIEILGASLNLPVNNIVTPNFRFKVSVDTKCDQNTKTIFLVVNIDIKNDDETFTYGSISASCVYEISNFEEVVKFSPSGALDIPRQVIDMFNSVSISTIRGVMFSTFKGTFLHNAVLPMFSPANMNINEINPISQ